MSRKTATVEVTKMEAWAILKGSQSYLGRIVSEYDERKAFQFLIDGAKADVAKWQAVLDAFDN